MIDRHFRRLALRVVILCDCSVFLMSLGAFAQQSVTSVSSNVITTTMPNGVIIVEDVLAGSVKITLPDGSYLLRTSKTAQWLYFDCTNKLRGPVAGNPFVNGMIQFVDPANGKTIRFGGGFTSLLDLPCYKGGGGNDPPGSGGGGGGGGGKNPRSKFIAGNYSAKGRPITTSQTDHQTDFWAMGPHQKREDDTTKWGLQPPSGKAFDVESIAHPGKSGPTKFKLHTGPAATVAETPQPQFVPHAPMLQTGSFFRVKDPPWDADLSKHFWAKAPFQDNSPTIGKIISSTADEADLIAMTNQLIDLSTAPSAWDQASKSMMWSRAQNISDATASSAQQSFETNVSMLMQTLPNIANEQSGTPGAITGALKPLSNALWMIQEMLKHVYIPMALLFLLPGAIVTQVKSYVSYSVTKTQDDDTVSPFVGILRSVIALFLIPATQLIVSYSIDIGNSMTYEVQKYIEPPAAVEWSKAQTVDQNTVKQDRLIPTSDFAQRSTMSVLQHLGLNSINMLLNYGLLVLITFQLVLACYLLLLGPIAASLFAWPSGIGSLFKPVFKSWLDGLTILVLWRFWWCIILLCMCVRIAWLKELGQYVPSGQWEAITYTAFMVMLTYVPFLPFDFRPGDLVDKLLEHSSEGAGLSKIGNSNPAPPGAASVPRMSPTSIV